jgi:hypothetical protein
MSCCGGGSARQIITTRTSQDGTVTTSTSFRYSSGPGKRAYVVECGGSESTVIIGDTEAQTAAARCAGVFRLATDAELAEHQGTT